VQHGNGQLHGFGFHDHLPSLVPRTGARAPAR
jgi:hypothetical protein